MKRHLLLILPLLILSVFFFVTSQDVSAVAGEETRNYNYEKKGGSREFVGLVGGAHAGQAYEAQVQGVQWGYGGFWGGSGGHGTIYGCLNATARMWDGSCWLFFRRQVADQKHVPFGPIIKSIGSDYGPKFKYFRTLTIVDDGRINVNLTVRSRSARVTKLTLDPSVTVKVGKRFSVFWNTEHAKEAHVSMEGAGIVCDHGSGARVNFNKEGSTGCTLRRTGKAAVTIKATGSFDNDVDSQTAYITGEPLLPATCSLSANPSTVDYNKKTRLRWTSTNASSCSASGDWSGSKGTSGSESTNNLTSNSSYTLNCSGEGGSGSCNTSVSVGAPSAAVTISCSPQTIPYNTSANVTWSSTNASSCTIFPTDWTGTSGSQSTGNLTSSQTYTVTCAGF